MGETPETSFLDSVKEPENFNPAPAPFDLLVSDLFLKLEAVNSENKAPFNSVSDKKTHIIESFIETWRTHFGNNIYSAVRLIFPNRDSRKYYIKDVALTRLVIKLLNLQKGSADYQMMQNWKKSYHQKRRLADDAERRNLGDFALIVSRIMSRRRNAADPVKSSVYLKDIADDEAHSHRLAHLMSQQKLLLRGKSFSVNRDLYAPLLASFPPRFNLQLVFYLLSKLPYSEKEVGAEAESANLERELIENWLAFLIPEISHGPFPFKVYQQEFTCKEDVARSLQNHRLVRGHGSVSPPPMRPKIETGRKKKVARALSLDEVLNSTTERVLPSKTDEPEGESFGFMSRKKPKPSSVFLKDASWKPAPFGVLP